MFTSVHITRLSTKLSQKLANYSLSFAIPLRFNLKKLSLSLSIVLSVPTHQISQRIWQRLIGKEKSIFSLITQPATLHTFFFNIDKGNSSYLKGWFGTAKSRWTVWTVIVQLLERLKIAIIEAVTIAFLFFLISPFKKT